MLVKIFGGAVYGINALTITIEVNILWGAKFIIVGLPDNAVKESQQRIDSALREIGLKIPGKRVIINMARRCKERRIVFRFTTSDWDSRC